MKFRRNIGEEKLFKYVAIGCLIACVIFLIIYYFTQDKDYIELWIYSIISTLLFFLISVSSRNDFVEFQKDKIIIINHKAPSFTINIANIETIFIPSAIALKHKTQGNNIILKRKHYLDFPNNFKLVISYTKEIEKYIVENLDVNIEYYDKYSLALKNA
ncbi:MAG: hypothetical protein IJ996_05250 [Clostridia bacterium]|nr:hypothetical protein [Clostridia bacterium]